MNCKDCMVYNVDAGRRRMRDELGNVYLFLHRTDECGSQSNSNLARTKGVYRLARLRKTIKHLYPVSLSRKSTDI